MRERQQKKQGLTLAELVMAMAITTIIGLTVAGVASALSHAYAHSEDYFESLQTARVSSIRLQRTINSSLLITAVDSEGLVLWEYDSNGNGKINLSEICIIEYDSDTKKLRTGSIRYPAGMDPSVRDGLDMTVPLYRLTDRIEAKSLLSGESYYKEQPLATNVQGFSISGNRSAPMTTMVNFRLDVASGAEQMVLRSSAAVRVDATGQVGLSDGEYVLMSDSEADADEDGDEDDEDGDEDSDEDDEDGDEDGDGDDEDGDGDDEDGDGDDEDGDGDDEDGDEDDEDGDGDWGSDLGGDYGSDPDGSAPGSGNGGPGNGNGSGNGNGGPGNGSGNGNGGPGNGNGQGNGNGNGNGNNGRDDDSENDAADDDPSTNNGNGSGGSDNGNHNGQQNGRRNGQSDGEDHEGDDDGEEDDDDEDDDDEDDREGKGRGRGKSKGKGKKGKK